MTNSRLSTAKLSFLAVVLLTTDLLFAPAQAFVSACENCHKSQSFRFQNKRLYDYYQDWTTSAHKKAGLTCEQCHGGNPQAVTMRQAHAGAQGVSDPRSAVFYRNQPKTCGKCHTAVVEQFLQSKHYQALMGNVLAPNCSTCHRPMNRKPRYRDIVESTCRTCHDEAYQSPLPSVSDLAHEILHRLNIAKGYLGWSRVYYESKGWPDNTRRHMTQLEQAYHDILVRGHSFDLISTDKASIELLTELKVLFRRAWKERASSSG